MYTSIVTRLSFIQKVFNFFVNYYSFLWSCSSIKFEMDTMIFEDAKILIQLFNLFENLFKAIYLKKS